MIRPNIARMAGYVPGEQPRDGDIVKLNTNESPYSPTPMVLDALRAAITGDRLRKYPDPSGIAFRRTAARVLGVQPDMILIGNGSDDILTIITRAFVPEGGLMVAPTPSYILYRSLAEIQGALFQSVAFTTDWQLPRPWPLPAADLTLVPNPNSPSGTHLDRNALDQLVPTLDGRPLVIDEAYVDFADENALPLVECPGVMVTRTLSKSYALAGMRFGYAVADAAIVHELLKVKDSYNCDALSLVAAEAALADQNYLAETVRRIRVTRSRLMTALEPLGFDVTPSAANFVWCRHRTLPHRPIYDALKQRRILIRYMDYPGYGDGLRITVGSDAEIDLLLTTLREVL